jgi:hypothetical protein
MNLALGCIDQAIDVLGTSFADRIPLILRKELEEQLGQLWNSKEAQDLGSLESELGDDLPPGVYDLVMAVVMLRDCSTSECDSEKVLECLSYCYQSVLDVEILSQLKRNMPESEMNVLEEQSPRCTRCIDGQLKLLSNIASGVYPQRMQVFRTEGM